MKITKRQLRKIIREEFSTAHGLNDDSIINALRDTWDAVRMDVGISNPTPEEMGDEAMAMIRTYHPREADILHSKSNTEIDELLWKAFGR